MSGALAAAALLLPAAAAAQGSGAEVLRTAMDRYEARLEGIDAVEIVQQTTLPMGGATSTETRLIRDTVGGRAVLVPAGGADGARSSVASIVAGLEKLTDRAELREPATVDGAATRVVAVDRLQELDFGQGSLSPGQGESFRADSAALYFDTDRYVLRRADVWGRMSAGGRRRSVTARVHFGDFRETRGYLHPYRTEARINVAGIGDQARSMMENLQQSGADSAQRAKLKEAVGALVGGEMTVTIRVRELRVNPGPDGS